MVFVLLQDLVCVFVSVEGVHEDERHVGVKGFVQMLKTRTTEFSSSSEAQSCVLDCFVRLYLDLLDGQVQEGVLVADADQTLGALAAHAGSQTAVQFDHGELVEAGSDVVRKTLRFDLFVRLNLSRDTFKGPEHQVWMGPERTII